MKDNSNKLNFKEFDSVIISEIEKVGGYNLGYLAGESYDQVHKDKYKIIKFEIPKEKRHFVLNTMKDNFNELGYQVFCPTLVMMKPQKRFAF